MADIIEQEHLPQEQSEEKVEAKAGIAEPVKLTEPKVVAVKQKDAYDIYLDKRKRNNKIMLVVSVALAFLLSLTVLIMSCIKVDIRPNILKSNPDNIKIIAADVRAEYGKNDANYDNVIKIYKDSFKLSFMASMFSGQLGDYKIEESLTVFDPSNEASIASIVGEQYVELSYNDEQTLRYKNGDVRYSVYNFGVPLTYDYVYFPVSSSNDYQDVTFYFAVRGSISEDSTSGVTTRQTKITVKTTMHNFIEKIKDLTKTKA